MVESFLGTENAMADEGVADLEQSLALVLFLSSRARLAAISCFSSCGSSLHM